MKTVGQRIAHLRENVLKLTQEKFADELGVTRGAVGNWELDKGIGRKNIEAIIRRFSVSPAWLIAGEGQVSTHDTVANHAKSLKTTPHIEVPTLEAPLASTNVVEVPILGSISDSAWYSMDDIHNIKASGNIPSVSGFPADWQFGMRVDDDCLGSVASSGDWLICLDIEKSKIEVTDGDLVIIERSRFDGQMIQRTARRVRRTGGGLELWSESGDKTQTPVVPGKLPVGEHVKILAKVLWVLRKP